MAKPVKSRITGKNLLLSVALGATPLVGCTPTPVQPIGTGASPVTQAVSPEERALFDQASQTGNPRLINRFLQEYPDSALIRRLLVNLPPETLQQVDRRILGAVSPVVLRSLPPDTRNSLGIDLTDIGAETDTSSADGYAG